VRTREALAPRSRALRAPLALTLALAMGLAMMVGAFELSAERFVRALAAAAGLPVRAVAADVNVLVHLRVPRVALGAMVGAALAVSGALLQGLLRNPLADLGLLGVSSGAGLASAVAIVLVPSLSERFGALGTAVPAFVGALAAVLTVLRVGTRGGRTDTASLVLAGVAVNALCGAATGLITSIADDGQLRALTFWSLGSLGNAGPLLLFTAAPALLSCVLLAPRLADALDALSLGPFEAASLGIDVERAQRSAVALAALAAAVTVSACGVIGFVGLVAPHLVRLLGGPAHRHVLRSSALCGAILVVLADLAARTVSRPAELPLGVVTALLGAPFFLWLLRAQRGDL
jgi:iron complex transport system permease protein